MAILQNSNCNDKATIIDSFRPFQDPTSIEGMIIGNDLDALISACLLKSQFNWNVFGIYDLKKIWHGIPLSELNEKILRKKIVAVDLDIYHPSIPSVGHHILTMTRKDTIPGHDQTLNPNLIRGIHNSNFPRKYPLGTIHFLAWLFNKTAGMSDAARDLMWLVDSSYINGQSHRFRSNVEEWIRVYFNDPQFLLHFEAIENIEFENRIKALIETIAQTGISVSRGQVESKHLKLRGGQCQIKNPNIDYEKVVRVLNLINQKTSWAIPSIPSNYDVITGERISAKLSETVTYDRLDQFLEDRSVFSYVIPGQGKINYTRGFTFN